MHLPSLALAALLSLSLHSFAAEPSASVRRAPRGVDRPMQEAVSRLPLSAQMTSAVALPPAPEGVEELKFAEFFKLPVGPRGLEPSERLRALDGKRVRLSGFFVFEDWSSCSCPPPATMPLTPAAARRQKAQPAWMKHVVPGRAMFAPLPVSVSLGHYGLCDDLPPQVAYLDITSRFGEPVMHQPGMFTVIGKLTLGTQEQPDGRTSFVHLRVEREEDIAPLPRRTAATNAPAPSPSAPIINPAAGVSAAR